MQVETISLELWGAVDDVDRRLPAAARKALAHVRVYGRTDLRFNGVKCLGLSHFSTATIEIELNHLSYAAMVETVAHELAHQFLKTTDEATVRAQVKAWGFEDPYRFYRT